MHIDRYIDPVKLGEYLHEGLVEVRHHPSLPLDLYVHSRRCTLEQVWDEVTCRTRGLIVSRNTGVVIARPFEKFFNCNTTWRPETLVSALPLTKPTISEKLDGSLGVLYTWAGQSAIATKGSFTSDQAVWATQWYADKIGAHWQYTDGNDKWPLGWTPVFEIIAESVQHHVVHYNGREEMVLIALINNETGEECDAASLEGWAARNGLRSATSYNKSLGDVLNEDRKNAEGYVLSWARAGQPPLKVKVKHPSFLELQKVVHAATPRSILEALTAGNVDLLNAWIGQTNDQLGQWVQGWVAKFNGKYGTVLLRCKLLTNAALSTCDSRKEFADYVNADTHENAHPSVCFAMLDDKDHKRIIWKLVEKAFESELGKPFALVDIEEVCD